MKTMTRLYAIDNLRVTLTVLVVVHHVALTYGNIPLWYYTEPAQDPSGAVLDILVSFNQAFFMGAFFLISGFFTPGAYDRRPQTFLKERLKRLGIPLLVYLLLLRPLATIGIYRQQGDLPYWKFYLGSWDPGPMWFVEVLLVFAALYALWRSTGRQVEAREAPLTTKAIVLFTAGLAVVTALWRVLVPIDTYVPVLGLPTPAYLPQYASLFAVGVLAARRGWYESLPRRAGWIGFAVTGAVTVALLPFLGNPVAHAVWDSTFAVGMILGLVVLFRERFTGEHRFLSDQAYAVYIIHPLVLVAVGYALSGWEAAAIVKFAVAAVICVPLCWGVAYLVRSLPGAKSVV
ncbi:acyltransferase family protein [Nonomuraea sp. NPDC050556]|uniref:acyltransferase family protein n=1 Tax=Nonomuraea sp. NPDC050556 TaxID=3364369 RepID=UPI0037AD793D